MVETPFRRDLDDEEIINFFIVCSIVGLFILGPVNYTCQQGPYQSKLSHSMDSFTISNIPKGSNRLWLHFSCLCFISFYVLHLLYKEYKGMLEKRIQHICNHRHQPDQFTVLVRGIPLCPEHNARGCFVDHFFSKYHSHSYESYQMVCDAKEIEELLHVASSLDRKIKNLQQRIAERKHSSRSIFSKMLQENVSQLEMQEEKLQEVLHKIHLLQHENILKGKELPAAFVSFRCRWGAALAAQTQQHEDPLLWITEVAPDPGDVLWNNLAIPYSQLVLHKIGVFIASALLTIFFALPVTAVQGIVQFENIKKWFPPVRAVQLIPGLSSVLTGYLPSFILNSFIYVVPYAMLSMANLGGCTSRSKREIKACNMVFCFLVGNVFFLSLLSGSLLDQIGESFTHPKDFPGRLASAVSAQADFFITYILTDGLSGFSLEILQFGLLIWHFIMAHSFGQETKNKPYLYSFPYFRVIPTVSLAILIGMVYAVIAPLLLPFLIVYFFLGYAVYVNQMQDVYESVYETHGQYWPYIHQYIFIAIILMQITMIGLFGLKSKPAASISTIPLLLLTILFNEYCKISFLPTFHHFPIKNARENDDRDEVEGQVEPKREPAIDAYRPPWLRSTDITSRESGFTQPLVTPP
ncbi:hypothetical protein Taro_035249 [Colocasia esculenta]|uniref:CSC1-like protein At3g54510 n=1 Tax=Colocasia esculenta TaxID=4460 RepID=A0A843WEC2_COLES|nr:hypothetical protein [Colocasia esculenta]